MSRIRVFARTANPATDSPLDTISKKDAHDLVSSGRAERLSRCRIRLLQRHTETRSFVARPASFGNFSGGDPAIWAIVGQTEMGGAPGFPHYMLINHGRPGLTAETDGGVP